MRIAFERKLVFTIGRSATTGRDDVIVWNGIHHKTRKYDPHNHGYPDPCYLDNVKQELAAVGVVENDLIDPNVTTTDWFKNAMTMTESCQPDGGTMVIWNKDSSILPGFESVSNGTIIVEYSFTDGIQGMHHPNPGKQYSALMFPMTARFPCNKAGRKMVG